MYSDRLLTLADDVSIAATGNSGAIDLADHDYLDWGEAMCVELTLHADAPAGGTYQVQVQTSDTENGAYESVETVTLTPSRLKAGYGKKIRFGEDTGPDRFKRWMRLRFTLGGTSPSLNYSAHLVPADFPGRWVGHRSGYAVS